MENRPYKCVECGVEFEAFDRMWEHMDVCGKPMSTGGLSWSFSNDCGMVIDPYLRFNGVILVTEDGRQWQVQKDGTFLEVGKGGSEGE